MAISKYFDEKLGIECYRVRVIRKSAAKGGLAIDREILSIRTLVEAEKTEKRLAREAERDLILSQDRQEKWSLLVEEWTLAVMNQNIFAGNLGKAALIDYTGLLKNYTEDWNNLRIDEIDKTRVWMKLDKVDREVSIARRKKLRTSIDAVFKWGILAGRIRATALPSEGFKSVKREDEKLPEILNLEEIRTLLKYAKGINHLWYPVWAVALYTGMRSGELFALRWSSIDFENRMIYVHENWTSKTGLGPTKGRYWRAVPLSEHVMLFLKELKLKTERTGFVLPRFESWQRGAQAMILREFCEGSGLPSIRFHTLRACFATQLIKDGVAPAVVMKIAGWRDLKTMQRYIRLAGIEVKGATDGLKLMQEDEVMGRVINMFEQ